LNHFKVIIEHLIHLIFCMCKQHHAVYAVKKVNEELSRKWKTERFFFKKKLITFSFEQIVTSLKYCYNKLYYKWTYSKI